MKNKPKLLALLVGIDQYRPPVDPLEGCVHDVDKMQAYLKANADGFQLRLRALTNEAATKANIVQGFREFLAQAGQGDTAFFYYSGHGTQEEADPALWRFETDGKLEALVCYDGILETEGETSFNLLADKELRYLIHELSEKGPNIVTIFDCCHSGGNTRNDYIGERREGVRRRRYTPSRLSKACPSRPWENFLFSAKVSPQSLKTKPLPEVLPVGRHIQLAACQSGQSAYEQNGKGAFTGGLIQLLEATGGQITYYGLAYRLRFLLRKTFDQSPQFYVGGDSEGGLFQGFLGRKVNSSPMNGNVVYNQEMGWILDLGGMHGINESIRQVRVNAVGGNTSLIARLSKIRPGHSILEFDGAARSQLKPGEVYKANLEGGLLAEPLQVTLEGPGEALAPLKEALEEQKGISVVEPGTAADYMVRVKEGKYFITPPGQPGQPLVKPVEGAGSTGAAVLATYLRHISRWAFIRSLHNPDTFLFDGHPVKMEFFRVQPGGSMKPLSIEGDEVKTEYEKRGGQWSGSIRVKLTNRHDGPLYVSLMFLSINFQVYPYLLSDSVILMEPGREAWVFEGKEIELDFPQQVADYKMLYSPAYFKLIAGTQEFDLSRFEQPPLPAPTADDAAQLRSIKLPGAFRAVGDDWITRLVALMVRNPLV